MKTAELEQKIKNTRIDEKELRWLLKGKIEALDEIKDMIDADIELYEGIIKSTEDKPTKMAFEGSVLALNKLRSKL